MTRLGPEHSILRGLRDKAYEPELTRTLAEVFRADPALASSFVKCVLRASKRPLDPRWDGLPDSFSCRSEVFVVGGFVDLEFADTATGWRVLVELKIDAGYGFEQMERYLQNLDPHDSKQVLVSVTRDVPKYGDPPLEGNPNWAGSVAWSSLFALLRELKPDNDRLAAQWPIFLDVLEYEGSMGVTSLEPELLLAWARAAPARRHAVAFADSLRYPLLEALRDALQQGDPSKLREDLADVGPGPTSGRRPEIDLRYLIPRSGPVHVQAQLWAWEDFRFVVSARYPLHDRSSEVAAAIARLARAGFDNYKSWWLWKSLALEDGLIESPELIDHLLHWGRARFEEIAHSGILNHPVEPIPAVQDDAGDEL